ncbi:MAG: hypothetical protein MUC35_05255 [Candidatus Margulisbacteria bacterium]|jgi:hypothetical protein|nr:hypothetical protein [Candidatus Margulisiibacteriota bacterium]
MAEPIINPVTPGSMNEAIAGNQGAIFTATDKKVIEERGGTVEKGTDFKSLFMRGDITTKVENEQTTVQQEEDIKELESRLKAHNRMLKRSNIIAPKDSASIGGPTPETAAIIPTPIVRKANPEAVLESLESVALSRETAKMAKELNLDAAELQDKLALSEEELHALVYKIKELHLQRLLTTGQDEFNALTAEIKKETLAASRPEAAAWLSEQLDKLTDDTRVYKQKLDRSIKSIGLTQAE